MNESVVTQLRAEIRRVEGEITQQKRLIKAHIGQTLAIETAEQELKALHTRLVVLTTNLDKMTSQSEAVIPAFGA